MDYRFMGKTGLKVSELCLGAMTFGRESSEAESFAMLNRFIEVGGNFIDTADVYGRGLSETILGAWLKQTDTPRENLIIASKVRFTMGNAPNDVGVSQKHILSAVDQSLKRLGVDYLDLYQVHCWDNKTPLEETLSTLHSLVQTGKVRYVGVSNYTGWQLQKAADLCKMNGWEPYTCLQPQYNLLCRTLEWEVIPVCENEGLGVIPWSPLRGGWLSGKYRRGMETPLPDTRISEAEKRGWGERWSNYNNEFTWQVIDALLTTAQEMGKHPAAVAIRWLLQKPTVTAPIIGARNLTQLEDNLGAVGWALSAEQMAQLDNASAPQRPYPYDFIHDALRK